MAIYSPNSRVNEKSIHGRGFYKICEELGVAKGKNAYELEEIEYGVSEIKKCHNYWKDKVVYDTKTLDYLFLTKKRWIFSLNGLENYTIKTTTTLFKRRSSC